MRLLKRAMLVTFVLSTAFCVDGGFAEPADHADSATYLADIVEALEVEWPENRTINIVCHGHSVPAGYFKTPVVDTFNAYPHLLHETLKERYPYAVVNVIMTAIGGESSGTGSERFERDVLGHRPDIVTIDYGLNDRGMGLEKSRANLVAMIEKAQGSGVKVILLTPTWDKRSDSGDPDDPLVLQAEQIREIAREYGVGLADSYAVFERYVEGDGNLDDVMSQVNHPNRAGHELVVEELLTWFPE